jgi:hypothetical protein
MKKIFLTTILIFSLTILKATEKEISIQIVFENLTKKEFSSGELRIMNPDLKLSIQSTESILMKLPKKGKYEFQFYSDDFNSIIIYPTKITEKKNIIKIQLTEKPNIKSKNSLNSINNYAEINETDEQIEQKLINGKLNFIFHGINDSPIENSFIFKEKYGIGFKTENCVVDTLTYKKSVENNQRIFEFLDKKYESKWLDDLKVKPFGIK